VFVIVPELQKLLLKRVYPKKGTDGLNVSSVQELNELCWATSTTKEQIFNLEITKTTDEEKVKRENSRKTRESSQVHSQVMLFTQVL